MKIKNNSPPLFSAKLFGYAIKNKTANPSFYFLKFGISPFIFCIALSPSLAGKSIHLLKQNENLLMKKILSLCVVYIIIITCTKAQEKYQPLLDRVQKSNYIFEGIVLETKPYKTTDDRMIYTSNLIEITKVFKGELECGTVELITTGGIVNEKEVSQSHALTLEKGYKGIFMAALTNKELSAVNFFNETNLEKLEGRFETQSYIKYLEDGAILKAFDKFQSWDSIVKLYDLTTIATGINYIDCNNAATLLYPTNPSNLTPENPQVFPIYKQSDYQNLINQAEYKRIHYTRKKDESRATNTITYKLANLKITGSTSKYLEFDVTVKDNIGSKYLDQSAVRIKYPTSVFGSNVVANNKILVSRGTINSNPTCYSNVIPTDRTNNVIFIPALEAVFSQCKNQITNSPISIMHIKMEIQNCNVSGATIAIEDTVTPFIGGTLMSNYSAFAEFPNDTFQTYYDIADANDVKAIPSCKATITDFSPKTVNGGVRDIVTLEGFQFGNSRGNGNLYFYDASFPSSGMSVPLEDSDYISWSDTLIKFYVPSIDTGINPQTIGTGKFRIVNDILEKDTSDVPLNIFYSLINLRSSNGSKQLHYLSNEANSGGYKIYIDTAVYHNAPLMGCIKKAIREWVCATGVNFTVIKDTFGIPTGAHLGDGINLISYGSLSGSSVAATFKATIPCLPIGFKFQDEFDIVIDISGNVFYDSTGTQTLPYSYDDMYRALLHEIGHAVGHAHVIEPTYIMNWELPAAPTSGLPANLRYTDIRYDISAIQGGRRMVNTTAGLTPISGCYSPMIPLSTCVGYNSINNLSIDISDISCFPNPFSKTITVESQKTLIENIEIVSLDGKIIHTFKSEIGKHTITIEIPFEISEGIYLIKVYNNENILSTKKMVHY